MRSTITRSARFFALTAALIISRGVWSQTIFLEEFDGGASTTGFVVDQTNVTDCRWEFAPDSAKQAGAVTDSEYESLRQTIMKRPN